LVLMDDFYKRKEAFLSMRVRGGRSGRQAAVPKFVGKFDTPRSQLGDDERRKLEKIPPQKRFNYFAAKVAADLCAEQMLSIAAVTLDCRHPREKSNIRASLFVVLGHESDRSTIDDGLGSLISQRTYKLLGSLVAGNLVESWESQDKTELGRVKGRIFPQGDPRALGYQGADFKAFFQDDGDGPQGGPPHNLRDDPLHHDVRHYFAQIFSFPYKDSEVSQAEKTVDEWAKREGQALEMHQLMKRIFAGTYDLTFNWLPVLAASCLKLDGVTSDGNPGVKLFSDSRKLSRLSRDKRKEFAEALLEFFVALRPKDAGANRRIEVKCLKDFFEIQVRPFDACEASESSVALIDKLTLNVTKPERQKGDLIESIEKIHRYLRLSGLQDPSRMSQQLCVLNVIPSPEGGDHSSCTFRFQSVPSTPSGVA